MNSIISFFLFKKLSWWNKQLLKKDAQEDPESTSYKRDNLFPNLEEAAFYEEFNGQMDALLAEQLSAVSGNFVFCENEIELFENLLYLAVVKNWRKIYCWELKLQKQLSNYEFPFYSTDTVFFMLI